MLGRSVVLSAKRSMSAIAADTPRGNIAQNILRFEAVATANSEAAVNAASKARYTVDAASLPEGLQGLERFFSSSAAVASKGFTPNPKHFRYAGIGEFISREASKEMTAGPFITGILIVAAGAVWIDTCLDDEYRKNSKFWQEREKLVGRGKNGHGHDDHAHH